MSKEALLDDNSALNNYTDQNSEQQLNSLSSIQNSKVQSVSTCIFNFINTSIGSGMLTMPYNYSTSGYVTGIIFCLIFAILSYISYQMLEEIAEYTGNFQFNTITNGLFPNFIGYISSILSMLFAFGSAISYVIIIKNNFFFLQNELYQDLLLAGIMLLVILPLTFIRNLDGLKITSYALVFTVCFLLFTVVYIYIIKVQTNSSSIHEIQPFQSQLIMINSLSLITQAYGCWHNFLNLYRELENRKENGKRIILVTLATVSVAYITIGLFGYFSFGSQTQSDVMSNLGQSGGVMGQIASVTIILLMIVHYPQPVYALRKQIENLIFNTDSYQNKIVQPIITAAVVLIATIIGMFVDQINIILNFTASLAGGTIGYVIPGLLYWKIGKKKQNNKMQIVGIMNCILGIIIVTLGFGWACWYWIIQPLIK